MYNDTRGSFTAEDIVKQLRQKNDPVLGVYARLIAADAAAQRVRKLAYSAMTAYAHHSPEEAAAALRGVDFATDMLSQHIEQALIGLDAEMSR